MLKYVRPYPYKEHQARLILGDPKALIYEMLNKIYIEDNNNINFIINNDMKLLEYALTHVEKKHLYNLIPNWLFGTIGSPYLSNAFWNKFFKFYEVDIPNENLRTNNTK